MQNVIDRFGRHRLLSFDRDPPPEGRPSRWPTRPCWIRGSACGSGSTKPATRSASIDVWQRRPPTGRPRGATRVCCCAGRDSNSSTRGRDPPILALSRDEQEFLSASIRQRDQERAEEGARAERERALERRSFQRLRALVAVLAVAALIAAGLTKVAMDRAGEAERRRDEATVAGLTGAALSHLRTDPELSFLLAIHAVDLSSSLGRPVPAATVEALHWAIQEAGVEYPVQDGPVAVVTGPLGTRGVFDLPLSQLMEAARSGVGRSLTASECRRFFGAPTCPSPKPSTPPSGLVAEPLISAGQTTPGQPLAGTEVDLLRAEKP